MLADFPMLIPDVRARSDALHFNFARQYAFETDSGSAALSRSWYVIRRMSCAVISIPLPSLRLFLGVLDHGLLTFA